MRSSIAPPANAMVSRALQAYPHETIGHASMHAAEANSNVAIKIARRKYASTAFQEISVHRRLEKHGYGAHPYLTNMKETFPHDGHVCIAFELHGRDLASIIGQRRMKTAEVKTITRQTLEGLAAVHDAGLIHTDIKPGNVLYDAAQKTARLADLGLATPTMSDGEEVGTCDYVPPEGILGTPMHSPVDLWALGCTIYKMLTGELLFDPWRACAAKYDEFSDWNVEDTEGTSSTDEDDPEQLSPDDIVAGKYRLIHRLGDGKFGTVWQAEALHDRPIKVPSADQFLEKARARRKAEGQESTRERWDLYEVTIAYEHLIQMQELLGPIPEHLSNGRWRSLFCQPDGSMRFGEKIASRPLETRLRSRMREFEAREAAAFLAPFLRFDPRERITAVEALRHPWLRD